MKEILLNTHNTPALSLLKVSTAIVEADPGEDWRSSNRLTEIGLLPALSSLLDANDGFDPAETALLRLTKASAAGNYIYLLTRAKRSANTVTYSGMALESRNGRRVDILRAPAKFPLRESLKFNELFAAYFFEPGDIADGVHKVFDGLHSVAGLDKWECGVDEQKRPDARHDLLETDNHAGDARFDSVDSVLEFCSRSYGSFRLKWRGRAVTVLNQFEVLFFKGLFGIMTDFR